MQVLFYFCNINIVLIGKYLWIRKLLQLTIHSFGRSAVQINNLRGHARYHLVSRLSAVETKTGKLFASTNI